MDETNITRVMDFLQAHGSITPDEAWIYCSCYRLSAVIYVLRKRGAHIRTYRMECKNRFGQPCRYAKYVLEDAT